MGWRLAWRNVFRNRRRAVFSLAVIVVGVSVLLFVLGFVGEALLSTQRSLAEETGALQIADPRLFDDTAEGYEALISPETLAETIAILDAETRITSYTWRLDFAGLVGDERGSTLVLGRGVVPCNSMQDFECLIDAGERLVDQGAREVVLGTRLARRLDVQVGDRVNIATGTVSGNFNAATVTVVGEMTYSLESLEEQLGLFPIGFVQRLLKTDGVERIQLGIADLREADAMADSLEAQLLQADIPLTVRTWEELNTSYASLQTFYTAFTGLAGIGVFVLVFFSVLEVLTMAFLERTREIGTLRSFGTTRARVFRSFLLEGILFGLVGGTAGVAFGVGVSLLFNAIGFTWTPPGAAIPQAIRLQLSLSGGLIPFFTAVGSTLVSTLYPAARNARLRIVDALRSQ